MRLTVAVTGTGGGVGQSIIKALRLSNLRCHIVAADCNPFAAGLYRGDSACLLPPADHREYGDKLADMLLEHEVAALFPGSDPELPAMARLKDQIEAKTGAKVIVSSPAVVDIAGDKWLTARFLEEHGLPHADSVLPENEAKLKDFLARHSFPLVLKPRRGSASRGVYLVWNRSQLDALLPEVEEPVLQEKLGESKQEYTCGLFCDAKGRLVGVITARRDLYAGTTYRAEVEDFPEVRSLVERIGSALRPRGPCNVQLRLTDRGPVAFEINARCSGTTCIRAHFGWNEPEAALSEFVLNREYKLNFRSGLALRYWNEVFVDPSLEQRLTKDGCLAEMESEVMTAF